jgi:hypothetical protein
MATQSVVFTNAQVLISTSTALGEHDVSNLVTSVDFSRTYDLLDDTVMGETAHSRKAGLESVTASIDFIQAFSTAGGYDLPDGSLDGLLNTLADLGSSGSSFLLAITPNANAIVSDVNPRYSFLAIIESYSPMTGAVGEILKTTVPFQSAGGSVDRATSS